MAVGYERIIFEGASIEEMNSALLAETACYKQLGRFSDAAGALSRIRLFVLTPEERAEVLYQKELCLFLAGDFEQAASLISEVQDSQDALLLHSLVLAYAGRYDESEIFAARCISWDGESPYLQELLQLYREQPAPRSPVTAMALSFFPPAGHLYNDSIGDAALSGVFNAAALAFTVANLCGGYWVTGILGGGIALNATFMGNQQRNAYLVDKNNRNDALAFGDRLRAFYTEHSIL